MTRDQFQMHLILRGLDQLQQKAVLRVLEGVPGAPRPVYFPRTGDTVTYVWDGHGTYSLVPQEAAE
jgi:hypothetical protein